MTSLSTSAPVLAPAGNRIGEFLCFLSELAFHQFCKLDRCDVANANHALVMLRLEEFEQLPRVRFACHEGLHVLETQKCVGVEAPVDIEKRRQICESVPAVFSKRRYVRAFEEPHPSRQVLGRDNKSVCHSELLGICAIHLPLLLLLLEPMGAIDSPASRNDRNDATNSLYPGSRAGLKEFGEPVPAASGHQCQAGHHAYQGDGANGLCPFRFSFSSVHMPSKAVAPRSIDHLLGASA